MTTTEYSAPDTASVRLLSVAAIAPSPLNPRTHFGDEDLANLAASIRAHGVLQPILVRPAGVDRAGVQMYTIVAGERRWRAATLADCPMIPAVVREGLTDAEHLELALIENLQRRDLDPIEEAEGYAQLNRVVGLRQAEIAAAVNRSQPAVANAMRLLELPEDVRAAIRGGELSVSHGVALARYRAFPALASKLGELAMRERWTAKRLESADAITEYGLEHARLVVPIYNLDEPPWTQCRDCPFGAYRRTSSGSRCLKPDHHAELAGEEAARRRAATQALIAAARAPAPGVSETGATDLGAPRVKLADLAVNSYATLWSVPAGCTEACPCRVTALDHRGEPQRVCGDPARLAGLRAAAQKAEKQRNKAALRADTAALQAAIDEMGVEKRAVVLLAKRALAGGQAKPLRATLGRHLPDLAADLEGKPSYLRGEVITLDRLGQHDLVTLLRAAVEALLSDELVTAYEGYGSGRTPWTDWYLGRATVPSEATTVADGSNLADPVCRVCGCSDADGCAGGCTWVLDEEGAETDLCSACATESFERRLAAGEVE